ncbi:hypothetical protein THRCLA_01066 [Thraustotheca clavata]|uniref:Transmembrane protein n=1 Tax=Thraustotheca clavata TaxID=74557 RepID=A0A1W0A9I8_9STRA|nr:hypothetical protein THRCLA_01066 [Thraustotheca clavata]
MRGNFTLFSVMYPLRQGEDTTSSTRGRSIYMLFEMNPAYKARPVINTRGSDCFLLCFAKNQQTRILRLSLISSLDMQSKNLSMGRRKVRDVPQATTRQKVYKVHHNYCMFATSLLMSLSIVALPFLAYTSESLPWSSRLLHIPQLDNFTEFNTSTLTYTQKLYNQSTLPQGSTYYPDIECDTFVFRRLLLPQEYTTCGSLLLGLPGVVFYNPTMNSIVCATINTNTSTINERGACLVVRFLSIPIAHECLWITQGDEIDRGNGDGLYTLTFVYSQYLYPPMLWLKFVVRCATFVLIMICLWKDYYHHYFTLADTLTYEGHKINQENTAIWRYHLVAGDPTAILVTNPYIVVAFFIDQWLSAHAIVEMIFRVLEYYSIPNALGAALFLFRMVWFAYGSICLINCILKRTKCEYFFAEVDPTIISIFSVVYIPGLWVILICILSPSKQNEEIELILVGIFYTILVALPPIVYGFFCRSRKKPKSKRIRYNSFRYNSLKNRALFSVVNLLRQSDITPGSSFGGNIYRLFEMNPAYKARPAINARGVDCFLLCYANDQLATMFRLSLISGLDLNIKTSTLAIVPYVEPSKFHVNMIKFHNNNKPEGSLSYYQVHEHTQIMLHRAQIPTVWCI